MTRCRRASDAHRWHAYLLVLGSRLDLEAKAEGNNEQWWSLTETMTKDLTYPVRYIIDKYGTDLEQA